MPTLTLDVLQQEIDYAVANQDWQGAFEAYTIVKDWLVESGLIKTDSRAYSQYLDYLMKLKFLSLNYFDDTQDYYDLLKNYFSLALEIPDYDLWGRLETQLVSMVDVNARDTFKAKLREALENSSSSLFNRQKYNEAEIPHKVSDWIKDFVANLGLDRFDKLKKMEYLSNGKNIKLLSEEDKNKVKILLDIYEKLRLSSKTPEGYENSVMMNIDGKAIIFDRGEIEELPVNVLKSIEDNRKEEMPAPASVSNSSGITSLMPSPSIPELETALKNYPPASLEHKAISQEISRLKVLELKRAQKSDAKK
jgi:hypothetical protein